MPRSSLDIGAEGARRTAERILAALERPYSSADQAIVPRASLGIALATEGVDADELIRNADIAMYTAKGDEARSYVFYEPSFHARLRRSAASSRWSSRARSSAASSRCTSSR